MEDAAVSIEGPETNGLCSKGAIVFGPSGEYGEGNAAELSSAATGCTANGSWPSSTAVSTFQGKDNRYKEKESSINLQIINRIIYCARALLYLSISLAT